VKTYKERQRRNYLYGGLLLRRTVDLNEAGLVDNKTSCIPIVAVNCAAILLATTIKLVTVASHLSA
jgi:hypothetical protein